MSNKIIIIGGGPAGIMAAIRASELGAHVFLLEKNPQLGTKFRLTGHGRSNITNLKSNKEFVKNFGQNGKFLFSALNEFGPAETVAFFNDLGVKTKTEEGDRVFPVSNKAESILTALADVLKNNGVEIATNTIVKKILLTDKKVRGVVLVNGQKIEADKIIVATGGLSYSQTGSTGDGYKWLKEMGHNIVKPCPALTPIICAEKFIAQLEGVSLSGVKISVYKDEKKIGEAIGEAIFTANGLSGPAIFGLSRLMTKYELKNLILEIDFAPDISLEVLDQKMRDHFQTSNTKMVVSALGELWPQKVASIFLTLMDINGGKQSNALLKEERKKIVALIKHFRLQINGLADFDRAMITSGGIDLKEVEPKTMASKLIKDLYLAGEVLDLDGPTGGYNLQVCWSTGYVAGEAAAR